MCCVSCKAVPGGTTDPGSTAKAGGSVGFAITGAVVGAGFDGAGWAGAVVGCTAAVVGAAIAGAVVGATAAVVGTAVGSSAASLHANAANATIDINMANSSPSLHWSPPHFHFTFVQTRKPLRSTIVIIGAQAAGVKTELHTT